MFIDEHRDVLGVEAIYQVLPIVPSTCYRWKSFEADPDKASRRRKRDIFLCS